MLFICSNTNAHPINLDFFVDQTHHKDLRFWTEKKHYYFFQMVEYIPKSPSYEYKTLRKNLIQYNIKSITISNDTMAFAELSYFSEKNKETIKIRYNYCYGHLGTHKYCKSEKIIVFEENEISVLCRIENNEHSGIPAYSISVTERYILDQNNNVIASVSNVMHEDELPEVTEIKYLYDDAGQLIEAKSYINDSLKYTLNREFFRDSIVETVNTKKTKVFYISELNYLPEKEKTEMFASSFTVLDSIVVYYNYSINYSEMYKVDVSLPSQVVEYRFSFLNSVMDFHSLYVWKPEDWIRLVYTGLIHPKEYFNYSKTFTSSGHDYFIYYNENLVAKKSGLIYGASYYILSSIIFDSEYMSYKFKYEYEFYE